MDIAPSARRHGVTDEDIHHALANAIRYHDLDDLVMVIGPTVAGGVIEVGVSTSDDDDPRVIHAMPARKQFL
jgi:hypothetical protein